MDVYSQINSQHRQNVKDSRNRLIPIIKTIILCGRIGIALRGHRDHGQLDLSKEIEKEEGNFRALLAYRVDAGDNVLKEHLEKANKNATYISKTTQNELIEICGDSVFRSIKNDIDESRYFSIIADETTDSSHKEQLCLCVRFVSRENGINRIREEFMKFKSVIDLSAENLANEIMDNLKSKNFDLDYLVGQGYDGASTMSGHVSGVQQRIQEMCPSAIYVHCSSHVLNLVLNSSNEVPEIRDMF